ncbi:hypothetical protein ER45_030345 (plasmid) [Bacillus mycoides]|nr:hypothetical protein ER45_030345 [Bacillus mycoides]
MAKYPVEINDQNYHDVVTKLVTNNEKHRKGSNLQNLPARGDGIRVRNAFKPQEGWIYLAADLSQIEPRIMAHIMWTVYGDNSLRSIFTEGKDLYTTMAMMVFGLEEKYCVDKAYDPTGKFKPRAMMKTGVLAKSYDQKVDNFCQTMKVTREVGDMFYEKFDTAFPSFITMVRDKRKFAYDNGYSETLYGRKRRFPYLAEHSKLVRRNERKLMDLYIERKRINSKKVKLKADCERLVQLEELIKPMADMRNMVGYWERASFNSVIQGTGADILKLNMIRLYRVCQEKGWYLNASIHDEIKVEVPIKDLTMENCDLITEIMTQSVELCLPLKSDTVIETVWGEEYDPSDWDFENQKPKNK